MASKKSKQQPKFSNSIVIENRKARFDYEILDKFEAGVQLTGAEVKSIRTGRASLSESYAHVRGEELYIRNMHIHPYELANVEMDPYRERKLLLHRNELNKLIGATAQKGLTAVPLKLYFTEKGWAKVLIGLCRGKKQHDKRETIKARDLDREAKREMKAHS